MDKKVVLEQWEVFLEDYVCHHHRNEFQLMMEQLLHRFPFERLQYCSNEDFYETIPQTEGKNRRSVRKFIRLFDSFLRLHGMERHY